MLGKTSTIQIRIDEQTKKQATRVLSGLHINMSEAIKLFLGQIVLTQGIPFELRIPSDKTKKVMDQVDANTGLRELSGTKQLFEELEH